MKGKKHRADGGKVMEYTADSNVAKEAKERKKGGRVSKDSARVEGKMAKMRLDRPGRKSGGRVGCDKSPLSSAARLSSTAGHSTDD